MRDYVAKQRYNCARGCLNLLSVTREASLLLAPSTTVTDERSQLGLSAVSENSITRVSFREIRFQRAPVSRIIVFVTARGARYFSALSTTPAGTFLCPRLRMPTGDSEILRDPTRSLRRLDIDAYNDVDPTKTHTEILCLSFPASPERERERESRS